MGSVPEAAEGPKAQPKAPPTGLPTAPQSSPPAAPQAPFCAAFQGPTCAPSPPTAAPAEQAITWADLQGAVKRRLTGDYLGRLPLSQEQATIRAARELETEFVSEQRKLPLEAHHQASFKCKSSFGGARQLYELTRRGVRPGGAATKAPEESPG